ncbi:MAG: sigma-70 family RNA polymerase sigma factor [Sphingomonadaceae bacterium]
MDGRDLPEQGAEERDPRQREREMAVTALAHRYRAGDRSALGELYTQLEPLVRAFLRPHLAPHRSLPPGLEAADLFQQSYVALAEAALEWEPLRRDNFMPYFLRSFPWRIDRYLRSQTPSRRTARFRLNSVSHDLLMEQVADTAGPDGRDWDDELLCADLLRGLPRTYDRVVRLHLYHGLPFAKVAEALGISRSAAHEAFRRALVLARSSLSGPPLATDGAASRESSSPLRGVDPDLVRRCVETLHRLAPDGDPLPGREAICREAGLTWREYREIMAGLCARGCVVGRRRGSPGSLACASPSETLRRAMSSE